MKTTPFVQPTTAARNDSHGGTDQQWDGRHPNGSGIRTVRILSLLWLGFIGFLLALDMVFVTYRPGGRIWPPSYYLFNALALLTHCVTASTPADRLDAVRSVLMAASGLLAVAHLQRPTTRRTLALLHDLLIPAGQGALHERVLAIMGSATLDGATVAQVLAQAIAAFDRAVVVKRTVVPFGFAIQPHLRPYYLAGTQELLTQGLHQEAMFWIACLDTAYLVLANDALAVEQPQWAAQFYELCAILGYTDDAAWPARVGAAEQVLQAIGALAASPSAAYAD